MKNFKKTLFAIALATLGATVLTSTQASAGCGEGSYGSYDSSPSYAYDSSPSYDSDYGHGYSYDHGSYGYGHHDGYDHRGSGHGSSRH
jgi:hypothetical protein